jgi:beta-glucosidase
LQKVYIFGIIFLSTGKENRNLDIKKIIKELTLEEKAGLCSGLGFWHTTPVSRLNIPSVMMTDGPHGIRKELAEGIVGNSFGNTAKATCFPPAVTVASAWDRELAYKMGDAIAREAMEQGVTTVLGPGVNIKRNPLCGRNFEYYSEDPYLAGEMASAFIDGCQANGIGTSIKHYAVNSQEYRRMSISSEVDERALREIYLAAFEKAVKRSRPYTIMASYNKINGEFACENKHILWDILREEWGYKGIVISDWGAVSDRVKGVAAGLDLEMPSSGGIRDKEIVKAVEEGKLSEADLNGAVERILEYVFKCAKKAETLSGYKADFGYSHALARKIAASGAVLLKNEGILPFSADEDFALIGALAETPRYQGAGSSQINVNNLVSLTDYLKEQNCKFSYAKGYGLKGSGYDLPLFEEAEALAKSKEKVVLAVGLTPEYEAEGYDRTHLNLPKGQTELITRLCAVNKNIVIVLSVGSAIEMPWADNKSIRAILNMNLTGEAYGEAVADIIFGRENPCGKLSETYPMSLDDILSYKYFGMGPQTVEYRESIFVGYRYFDTAKVPVRYPFGYGLSYTSFKYSDLKLDKAVIGDKDKLKVSFTLENTGNRKGAEIAQIYVRDIKSTHFVPSKELKEFVKAELEPGEKKEITIELSKDAFSFYNTKTRSFEVEPGEFEILVGASSADIKMKSKVKYECANVEIEDLRDKAPSYYNLKGVTAIPDGEYYAVLGRKLAPNYKKKKGELDLNSTLGETDVSLAGRLLTGMVKFASRFALGKGAEEVQKALVANMMLDLPLRNIYAMTGGRLSKKSTEGLLLMFNGHSFRGIGRFIAGFFGKPKRKEKVIAKIQKADNSK